MGWILHQEGKHAEAEPYLRAAWHSRPNAEVGEHLGDVLNALYQVDEAARTYVEASYLAARAEGDPTPSLKTKSAAAHERLHGTFPSAKVNDALRALSTVPLGTSQLPACAVQYRILFTRDRSKALKSLRGDATPARDEMVRKANFAPYFPDPEPAAMLRDAMLDCRDGSCNLLLDQ